MFTWRGEGIGFRTIAARLTDDGIPSPSATDRERNQHRPGLAWSVSAVRAIVLNPKCKGVNVIRTVPQSRTAIRPC
ncbi:MAG: recombinase family protein [Acidimicrobiales bacterium]